MTSKNIVAYTAPGATPPYISINDNNGLVSITVRGEQNEEKERRAVTLDMPREFWIEAARAILNHFGVDK